MCSLQLNKREAVLRINKTAARRANDATYKADLDKLILLLLIGFLFTVSQTIIEQPRVPKMNSFPST